MAAALKDAWQYLPTRRGVVGVLLIILGSLTPAYLPENSPLLALPGVGFFQTLVGRGFGTVAAMVGVALLLDAWFRLRPRGVAAPDLRAVLALWCAPFLIAPPVFSADAYAYAAEGWLIHNRLNPYDVGVGVLPGAFADQTVLVWRWTPAPYGPLALQLNHLVVDLAGHHPYLSTLAMRIPVLAGVFAMAIMLPALAKRFGFSPRYALWLGVLNPLAVVHFAGGAHNDAIMIGLILVALWLAVRGRMFLATFVVAAAAAMKVPAVVALLAVVVLSDPVLNAHNTLALPERLRAVLSERASQWRMVRRGLVVGVAAVVFFLAINLATGLGFGWIAGMNVPGQVRTMAPSTMIGDAIGMFFANLGMYGLAFDSLRTVRTLFMLACVAWILWLSFKVAYKRPVTALSWSLLAVAFCGPVLHGWYVFWGGSLLGLTQVTKRIERVAVWMSSGLLVYIAMNAAWKNEMTLLGAVAVGLIAWQVWLHDRALADAPDPDRLLDPQFQPALGVVSVPRTR